MDECRCETETSVPWCPEHGLDAATLDWLYSFGLCSARYAWQFRDIYDTRISRQAWSRLSTQLAPRSRVHAATAESGEAQE